MPVASGVLAAASQARPSGLRHRPGDVLPVEIPDAGTRAGRAVRCLVTFHVVCLAWVFFRAHSVEAALTLLSRIPHPGPSPLVTLPVLVAIAAGLATQVIPTRFWTGLQRAFSALPVVVQGSFSVPSSCSSPPWSPTRESRRSSTSGSRAAAMTQTFERSDEHYIDEVAHPAARQRSGLLTARQTVAVVVVALVTAALLDSHALLRAGEGMTPGAHPEHHPGGGAAAGPVRRSTGLNRPRSAFDDALGRDDSGGGVITGGVVPPPLPAVPEPSVDVLPAPARSAGRVPAASDSTSAAGAPELTSPGDVAGQGRDPDPAADPAAPAPGARDR